MDLKQLEAFVNVVQHNSFSKAAEELYLSQPTVSAHISSLEKELDAQLLIRSTKEVFPTKTGKDLYVYAQNILSLRDEALAAITGSDRACKGSITILASSVPAQYLLPEAVTAFKGRYPGIIIHVEQADSGAVAENLGSSLYDFGIVGTKIAGGRFTHVPFYTDTLVLAYPAKMQLDEARLDDALPEFIKETPCVMRERGSGTRQELERFLEAMGLDSSSLKPAGYFANTQGAVHAVACGLGFSFVSKAAVTLYEQMGLIKTKEISPERFSRRFYILLKKELVPSPIQRKFIDYLPEYFGFAGDED